MPTRIATAARWAGTAALPGLCPRPWWAGSPRLDWRPDGKGGGRRPPPPFPATRAPYPPPEYPPPAPRAYRFFSAHWCGLSADAERKTTMPPAGGRYRLRRAAPPGVAGCPHSAAHGAAPPRRGRVPLGRTWRRSSGLPVLRTGLRPPGVAGCPRGRTWTAAKLALQARGSLRSPCNTDQLAQVAPPSGAPTLATLAAAGGGLQSRHVVRYAPRAIPTS